MKDENKGSMESERMEIHEQVKALSMVGKDKVSKKALKYFKRHIGSEAVLEVLHNSFYNQIRSNLIKTDITCQ